MNPLAAAASAAARRLALASCLALAASATAESMRPSSLAGGAATATTSAAAATTEASPEPLSGMGGSRPGAPHDYAVGLTAIFENDGTIAKPNNNTDRHYTAGIGVAVQWQAPWLTELLGGLPSLGGEFDPSHPGVSYSMGLICAMQIYTPEDLTRKDPIYDDRPYAGWSYAGVIAQRASRYADTPVFEHFEFDGGTVGPSGHAGDVQRWVHQRFGYVEPNGWDNQVRDEVGADFKYLRRYRIDLLTSDRPQGPGVQVLPDAGLVAGTIHSNLNAGAALRAGWNLPNDFGPGSLQLPADYTAPKFGADDFSWNGFTRSLSAYAFVRPAGRMVLHDSTIEGSYFRDNLVTQDAQTWVGEVQGGVVISMLRCIELGYSQTYSTREFTRQRGTDSYGSISLRVNYTW